jgi:hypothetical protein
MGETESAAQTPAADAEEKSATQQVPPEEPTVPDDTGTSPSPDTKYNG